jgi:hypothetical protein
VVVAAVPDGVVVFVVVVAVVVLRVSAWPNAIAPVRSTARIAAVIHFMFASTTLCE